MIKIDQPNISWFSPTYSEGKMPKMVDLKKIGLTLHFYEFKFSRSAELQKAIREADQENAYLVFFFLNGDVITIFTEKDTQADFVKIWGQPGTLHPCFVPKEKLKEYIT